MDFSTLTLADISVESFEVNFGEITEAEMAYMVANPSSCPTSDGCTGCD